MMNNTEIKDKIVSLAGEIIALAGEFKIPEDDPSLPLPERDAINQLATPAKRAADAVRENAEEVRVYAKEVANLIGSGVVIGGDA